MEEIKLSSLVYPTLSSIPWILKVLDPRSITDLTSVDKHRDNVFYSDLNHAQKTGSYRKSNENCQRIVRCLSMSLREIADKIHPCRVNRFYSNCFLRAAKCGNLNYLLSFEVNTIEPEFIDEAAIKASKYNKIPVLDFLRKLSPIKYIKESIIAASEGNHIDVLKWFSDSIFIHSVEAVDAAIQNGSLFVLKWFHENGYSLKHTSDAIKNAIMMGDVEMLEWFRKIEYPISIPENSIDYAASNSQITTIQWLMKHYPESKYTYQALDGAAENDYLYVYTWFRDNNFRILHRNAIKLAVRYGHIRILKWLYENGRVKHGKLHKKTLDGAIKNGNINVLFWWFTQPKWPRLYSKSSLTVAATKGYINVLTYLDDLDFEDDIMDQCCSNGSITVLNWLHGKDFQFQDVTETIIMVCRNGNVDALEWLKNHGYLSHCFEAAVDAAAEYGKMEVIEWFHLNRYFPKSTTKAVDGAAKNGHIEILNLLSELDRHILSGFRYTEKAINNASKNGHVEVLEWFKKQPFKDFKYSNQALYQAAIWGHIPVLEWFYRDNCNEMISHNPKCNFIEFVIKNNLTDVLRWFVKKGIVSSSTITASKCYAATYGNNQEILDILNLVKKRRNTNSIGMKQNIYEQWVRCA